VNFCPYWPWTKILLISQVARITGMSHHA
jgi:hypothetical protein